MKQVKRYTALLGVAFLMGWGNVSHAKVLFFDDFDFDLSAWADKEGGTEHHGQIVYDPIIHSALTFTELNDEGDIFSQLITNPSGEYILSFEYLGSAQPGSEPDDFGGFIGYYEPDSDHYVWLAASQADYPGIKAHLPDTGAEELISISFTAGTSIQIVLKDSKGVPGDTLFDEILVRDAESFTCDKLCAIDDKGLNNSQFLILGGPPPGVIKSGPLLPGYDLEALTRHPHTKELYAASGDNTKQKGHLYKLDECNGDSLTLVGNIVDKDTGYDYKEVDALSFHFSGTLWGWAQNDGLLKIDPDNATAELVVPYEGEIEDMTWNPHNNILIGVQNLHIDGVDSHGSPDFELGVLAWFYHPAGWAYEFCPDLTTQAGDRVEIEALELLPDGLLVVGLHKSDAALFVGVTPACEIIELNEIPVKADIEGIVCW